MTIYFSDIKQGATFESLGRTVTETDIVSFAGLSGDFNPLHMDDVWVRENTAYPRRVAHGLLVLAMGEGLRCPGVDDWQILAFLEVQRKMLKPVFPGDRIHQVLTVEETRRSTSRPEQGVVTVSVEVRNQAGLTVQAGRDIYLVGGDPK